MGKVASNFEMLVALAKGTPGCRVQDDTVYISIEVSDNMPSYITELRDKHGYIVQTEIT